VASASQSFGQEDDISVIAVTRTTVWEPFWHRHTSRKYQATGTNLAACNCIHEWSPHPPGRRKIQDETLWIPVTRIPVLRLEERILCL
jgi:hypothetical protein